MNTFELTNRKTLSELSGHEVYSILDALRNPAEDYISIQLQEVHSPEGSLLELYGIYFMTAEEVSNYDNNGELWMYYTINTMKSMLGE